MLGGGKSSSRESALGAGSWGLLAGVSWDCRYSRRGGCQLMGCAGQQHSGSQEAMGHGPRLASLVEAGDKGAGSPVCLPWPLLVLMTNPDSEASPPPQPCSALHPAGHLAPSPHPALCPVCPHWASKSSGPQHNPHLLPASICRPRAPGRGDCFAPLSMAYVTDQSLLGKKEG